jgi:hypothetical protein
MDHSIRCQTVHSAEQAVTIERVGDDRRVAVSVTLVLGLWSAPSATTNVI